MTSIATSEPAELRVGDTWQWRREDLSDYPASLWTLTYYVRNASAYFDIVATADGVNFAISVAKATTALKTAGEYTWVAVVSDATYRYEVDSGSFTLLPNYGTAAAYDGRKFAQRLLDSVEAILENRATTDQLDLVSSAIGDRSLTRDMAEMWKLRTNLRGEVKREEAAEAMRNGESRNRLLVRFS